MREGGDGNEDGIRRLSSTRSRRLSTTPLGVEDRRKKSKRKSNFVVILSKWGRIVSRSRYTNKFLISTDRCFTRGTGVESRKVHTFDETHACKRNDTGAKPPRLVEAKQFWKLFRSSLIFSLF